MRRVNKVFIAIFSAMVGFWVRTLGNYWWEHSGDLIPMGILMVGVIGLSIGVGALIEERD